MEPEPFPQDIPIDDPGKEAEIEKLENELGRPLRGEERARIYLGMDIGQGRVEKQNEWQRYEGPKGGQGWQNTQTGEIVYQDERPGSGHETSSGMQAVTEFIENAPEPELEDLPEGDIANPLKTEDELEPRDVPGGPVDWNLPAEHEGATTIAINDLITGQHSLNSEKLRHAAATLESGQEMPPIEYTDAAGMMSDDYIPAVADGNHRVVAAWLLGREEVPAVPGSVVKGKVEKGEGTRWQPYEGPRGGEGWYHPQTGEVRYQENPPDVVNPQELEPGDLVEWNHEEYEVFEVVGDGPGAQVRIGEEGEEWVQPEDLKPVDYEKTTSHPPPLPEWAHDEYEEGQLPDPEGWERQETVEETIEYIEQEGLAGNVTPQVAEMPKEQLELVSRGLYRMVEEWDLPAPPQIHHQPQEKINAAGLYGSGYNKQGEYTLDPDEETPKTITLNYGGEEIEYQEDYFDATQKWFSDRNVALEEAINEKGAEIAELKEEYYEDHWLVEEKREELQELYEEWEQSEKRSHASFNAETTFIHEFGHYMDDILGLEYTDARKKVFNVSSKRKSGLADPGRYLTGKGRRLARRISGYAATSDKEYIAESWLSYVMGEDKKLPDKVKRFWDMASETLEGYDTMDDWQEYRREYRSEHNEDPTVSIRDAGWKH